MRPSGNIHRHELSGDLVSERSPSRRGVGQPIGKLGAVRAGQHQADAVAEDGEGQEASCSSS